MYKIDDVEFSEETIKSALIKAGHKFDKPEPKFEPIRVYQFCVDVGKHYTDTAFPIVIGLDVEYTKDSQMPLPYTTKSIIAVKEFIQALQSAIAFVEANRQS